MIVTRHSAVAGDNGKFNGTQDASNRYDRRQANHSIIQSLPRSLARLSNIEICQMEFSVVNRQETYATPICQLVYSVVCILLLLSANIIFFVFFKPSIILLADDKTHL